MGYTTSESVAQRPALEGLVSFYRAEGAFEELTELYLGQLENQTERRLPLYQV